MTEDEWAQRLNRDARVVAPVWLEWSEAVQIADLLQRAARIKEAARNVLAAADLCDYWYEDDIAPLKAALEEKE